MTERRKRGIMSTACCPVVHFNLNLRSPAHSRGSTGDLFLRGGLAPSEHFRGIQRWWTAVGQSQAWVNDAGLAYAPRVSTGPREKSSCGRPSSERPKGGAESLTEGFLSGNPSALTTSGQRWGRITTTYNTEEGTSAVSALRCCSYVAHSGDEQ